MDVVGVMGQGLALHCMSEQESTPPAEHGHLTQRQLDVMFKVGPEALKTLRL